ncbi:MAG: peptidylprolyl isomerase [Moraxellaceae bacterium]|jgi:FKBP-type peptidyl-prolyl cis-trans isomerase SlyD|nr:MAG: peptidylprolyl isomerase [Moraxellaceae bacterium]
MSISKDQVVSVHYRVSEAGGPELEHNFDTMPMVYLHGHNNLMPALEKALDGKNIGDTLEVTLPAAEAYGPYIEGATQRVPIKKLLDKPKRLLVGGLVQVNTDKGVASARVLKVGKFNVDVDLNHPFAGKDLAFYVEVKDIRAATEEELAHGHAHGDGGHHH